MYQTCSCHVHGDAHECSQSLRAIALCRHTYTGVHQEARSRRDIRHARLLLWTRRVDARDLASDAQLVCAAVRRVAEVCAVRERLARAVVVRDAALRLAAEDGAAEHAVGRTRFLHDELQRAAALALGDSEGASVRIRRRADAVAAAHGLPRRQALALARATSATRCRRR